LFFESSLPCAVAIVVDEAGMNTRRRENSATEVVRCHERHLIIREVGLKTARNVYAGPFQRLENTYVTCIFMKVQRYLSTVLTAYAVIDTVSSAFLEDSG
jgi:hypothetical protein